MSKFQGVIDAAKSREDTAGAKPAPLVMPPRRQGRGRPPGKRRNPDFEQVTAYIRKHTHQGVSPPQCRAEAEPYPADAATAGAKLRPQPLVLSQGRLAPLGMGLVLWACLGNMGE